MTTDAQYSPEVLQNAFDAFNQLSSQLPSSYQVLEQHVTHRNAELNRTQAAYISELAQNARLSNCASTLLHVLLSRIVMLDCDGIAQESIPAVQDLPGEPLSGLSSTYQQIMNMQV